MTHVCDMTHLRDMTHMCDMTHVCDTAPKVGKHPQCAFGRISWDPKKEPAHYVRIPPQLVALSMSAAKPTSPSHPLHHPPPSHHHPQHNTNAHAPTPLPVHTPAPSPPPPPPGPPPHHPPVAPSPPPRGGGGGGGGGGNYLSGLIKVFAERVWGLQRPRLVVSLVGSSSDFDLSPEDRQTLLPALLQLAEVSLQRTATLNCNIYIYICNTLQHGAALCDTLQHSSTHSCPLSFNWPRSHCNTMCNTLQHTSTHCNTLQHTATH